MRKTKQKALDSSVAGGSGVKSPESLNQSNRRNATKPAGGRSKREQLIDLISRARGARLEVLIEKLGWQAHTVRAAISRLRKQGFDIERTEERRSGKPIYVVKQAGVVAEGRAHG